MTGLPQAPHSDGPWPDVVRFETADGALYPVPPLDGRAYRVRVAPGRLADYEGLARSGRLYRLYDRAELHAGEGWAPQPWRVVLGLAPSPAVVNAADVGKAFRRLALERHPDQGGSHEAVLELVAARDAALHDLMSGER